MNILVLHGPNLNLVGKREPEIYGSMTLEEINEKLKALSGEIGARLRIRHSNSEGEMIDIIHDAMGWASGLVINAGGYTHTSVALRDAVAGSGMRAVEVHISNIHAREPFRHTSLLAPVCVGQITGLGWQGYFLAIQWLVETGNQ